MEWLSYTDEGVGVVQLPLTLAQMKGVEWLLPLTLAQMKGLEWLLPLTLAQMKGLE